MYARICTRLNVVFVTGFLGRYRWNPRHDHWVAVNKVLRYLKKTSDYMLIYRHVQFLQLVEYLDVNFAGCSDDMQSITEYIFMLVGSAVNKVLCHLLLCKQC